MNSRIPHSESSLEGVVNIEQEFHLAQEAEKGSGAIIYNPRRHLPLEQQRRQLPIYSYRKEFLWAIHISRVVVVVGDTGIGKSTQLPQYLGEAKWTSNERVILVVVPMRIAAISLATRVAEECGCEIGTRVGYITGEQSCYTESTHIRYITDGVLLQLLQFDPLLLNVAVIILDDCHQRRLEGDLILALVKKIHIKRPYLRVVVSSATVDTEFFVRFFSSKNTQQKNEEFKRQLASEKASKFSTRWNSMPSHVNRGDQSACLSTFKVPEILLDVSVLRISERCYPIHIKYLKFPCPDYIKAAFQIILRIHKTSKDMDTILVFLCGREEVESLANQLAEAKESEVNSEAGLGSLDICSLYGSLPINVQLEAFRPPSRGRRKVILTTNIAESAVTINRVGYIVDTGLVKISIYNAKANKEMLCTVPVSKQSAKQRAGRAGRVQEGVCYRLYTESFFEKEMQDFSIPELMRADLSFLVLYLLSLGIENFLTQFDLPTAVSSEALISAFSKLHALQAVNDFGQLTEDYGKPMAELIPLDPLLSRFLVYSTKAQVPCSYEATVIVAMIMSGNPWVIPNPKSRLKPKLLEASMRSIGVREGDLVTLYNVYKQAEFYRPEDSQWESRHMINSKVLKRAELIQQRLEKKLSSWNINLVSVGDDVLSLQKSICASFFLNAAYRRGDGRYTLCVSSQRSQYLSKKADSLVIHPYSLTNPHQPPFVVFHRSLMINNLNGSDDTYMIHVTPVDPMWFTDVAGHYFKLQYSSYHEEQ